MRTTTRLLSWTIIAAAVLWFRPTTFEQRWAPVVVYPLHYMSWARSGFCHPTKCLNG